MKICDECQRAGRISKKTEMPRTTILKIDIFDVWALTLWEFCEFLWERLHFGRGGLCVQMG